MENTQEQVKVLNPCTVWFTGLSGAGKSTIAIEVKKRIDSMLGREDKVFILDGDIVRQGLNKDLGFSADDRTENIRRISEVSKLFNISGQITLSAFISPYTKDRDFAREVHSATKFFEAYVSTSLECCEKRDVKGLYKKARAGIIPNFTGISDPYEAPVSPEMDLNTEGKTIEETDDEVIDYLVSQNVLTQNSSVRNCIDSIIVDDEDLVAKSQDLPSITMDLEHVQYLHCLADGWSGKLQNFMSELQLLEVLHYKTLTIENDRFLHSVPITCHASDEEKANCEGKSEITLRDHNGNPIAVMDNPVFYENRKEEIAARLFGTTSNKHPKIENINKEGPWLVSGSRLRVLKQIKYDDGLDQYRLTPEQIEQEAKSRGADVVFAFQLRNPLHNGHVMLLKSTRDSLIAQGYKNPVLLLHPLGGWIKDDDVPLDIRIKQHQALIEDGNLDPNTILAIWPSPMYYGGPSEVLWHVGSRLNAGVKYVIVGRDPAGIGHPEQDGVALYDPFHGQKVIDLGLKLFSRKVEIMAFKVAAYNKVEKKMAFFDPSKKEEFEFISGTKMRAVAREGGSLPDGFMNEKGWKVLSDYYKSL